MRLRIAKEIVREGYATANDRIQGMPPRPLMMAASRALELQIGDVTKLPVRARGEEDQLQDGSGNFYFLADYSAIGGPDVVKG